MRTAIVIAAVSSLTACAIEPSISDLEEDKVVVQSYGEQIPAATQVASDGCAIHGREAYGPISRATTPNGGPYLYLFACK